MAPMSARLSPYRLKKARSVYNGFNILNALSFLFLSGNIITLFALRLGASPSVVGVLNALQYVSFFFMPLGKRFVSRFRIVPVFATAWLVRYLVMLPLAAAAAIVGSWGLQAALAVMVLTVLAFNAFRGVGMIGNNPVLNMLATGSDRGGYMTQVQIVNSAVGMLGSLGLAFLLGRRPPIAMYGWIVAAGIAIGVVAALFVYRIPEPSQEADEDEADGLAEDERLPVPRSRGFLRTATSALAEPGFRTFVGVFFLLSFASSMARPFTIVYSRVVYAQGDGIIALLNVAGGLGALSMGLLTRLLVDRVGAKPLYLMYAAAAALSLIPAVATPALGGQLVVVVFLIFLQFIVNFGFAGTEGVAQNYFFGLVKPRDVLDLGILYYFVYGAAGAAGSTLGGFLLDWLSALGFGVAASYRIFFSSLIVVLLIALALGSRLVSLGALSFRGALGVIFSFRDLRAIGLLQRLERSSSPGEEAALLDALHDTPTAMGVGALLERLRSPRLAVRLETLRAMEALERLPREAEDALMRDAEQNPYTTAYSAARILGAKGVHRAVPLLRSALGSEDYMLAGEAMVALARLSDRASIETIHRLLPTSDNPRFLIRGATALEIFADPSSLAVLLDLLRREAPPPFLRDEIILSISGILGMAGGFYRVYLRFLNDRALSLDLALDEIDATYERRRAGLGRAAAGAIEDSWRTLRDAAAPFVSGGDGAALSLWMHQRAGKGADFAAALLAEAALDPDLVCYDRFRFMLVCWTASLL